MKEITIGEAIRRRRKELGLSQMQVCEGICSLNTLSRIETGTQTPSYNNLVALLERLGMPSDRFYGLLSEHEEELGKRRKELLACWVRYQRASSNAKSRIKGQALNALRKVEEIAEKNDVITRQYILTARIALGNEGDDSPIKTRAALLEALRLTIPHFDLKEINKSRYSIDETRIINQIAITFVENGEKETAIEIFQQLLQYVYEHDRNLAQYAGHISLVAHNYACVLDLEGRYEEAIEIALWGKKVCIEYAHYQFLPGFLAILAECNFLCGKEKESARFYRQAHILYQIIEDKRNLEKIDAEAIKYLGIDFSDL